MYFLRRRHGRKPQSEARAEPRREAPPAPPETSMDFVEQDAAEPPKPVVITKPKRQRVLPGTDEDAKPGTFRSGTLHLAHGNRQEPSHGKA